MNLSDALKAAEAVGGFKRMTLHPSGRDWQCSIIWHDSEGWSVHTALTAEEALQTALLFKPNQVSGRKLPAPEPSVWD